MNAEQKQAMAFDLSPFDEKTLKFKDLFAARFMDINVSLPLNDALDLAAVLRGQCTANRRYDTGR